jgi:hypothetical protein
MLIVLDTNLFPRKGKLQSVEIATLLRVAPALGATVSIPRIVLSEAINARQDLIREAIDRHNSAMSNIAKYCDVDSPYIPSLETLVDEWKGALESSFSILEIEGSDAVEALEREAMRRKPAKSNGTGARDSAIWLCVKREHFKGSSDTHFVSGNTEDFASSRRNHSLHPDLMEELGERGADFHYHTKIESLIQFLCSRVEVSLSMGSFPDGILLSIIDQIIGHEDLNKFPDFSDRDSEDFEPVEDLYLTEVNVRSAYSAAGTKVGFMSASFQMPLASEAHDEFGTSVDGKLGGWFVLPSSGEVSEFEVTLLNSLEYVREDGVAVVVNDSSSGQAGCR